MDWNEMIDRVVEKLRNKDMDGAKELLVRMGKGKMDAAGWEAKLEVCRLADEGNELAGLLSYLVMAVDVLDWELKRVQSLIVKEKVNGSTERIQAGGWGSEEEGDTGGGRQGEVG